MAERDQIVRLLGRHDRGDPGRGKDIAFLGIARQGKIEGRLSHDDPAFRDRDAFGRGLARNIDHMGLPGGGKMGEVRHGGDSILKGGERAGKNHPRWGL